MTIDQVEKNTASLVENFNPDSFIFDLLLAYGLPRATITLLKKGRHDLSQKAGRVILKRKVLFQVEIESDLHETIDQLQKDPTTHRHSPRFIIVTDFKTLLAIDTKTNETLDIPIKNLSKHYDFFLPWSGIEKHRLESENPADRKAAEKMAHLYDEILEENTINDDTKRHDLNVFLTRLLFCFFAEDTNIFEDKLFTKSVASHTQSDGSDFADYVERLFDVLSSKNREGLPDYLRKFPYVNGGLFNKKHWTPKFTAKSRKIIIECGELNWSKINPDIFGSMMQAVVHPGERGSLGMHYTSVPNIMKVIEPLFLEELRNEFEDNRGNKKKLEKLLARLSKIKFFDPACGSGNFLIISYKELRRLEIQIIKEIGAFSFSNISLSNFYGIEIDDFAHELAKLSLYLAEHQMNIEFKNELSDVSPTLPLKSSGNIVCANACRIDWESVCPANTNEEMFIMGNPPYIGSKTQSTEQKRDLEIVFSGLGKYGELDYISSWFVLASIYIGKSKGRYALVATSSVCQGSQVQQLWPIIFNFGQEIEFAYRPFKWSNNAKNNAGVSVTIIGIRNIEKKDKFLFDGIHTQKVSNISPYLLLTDNTIVIQRLSPISKIPRMITGNSPYDNNYLRFSNLERADLLADNPNLNKYIKRVVGSDEFLNGIEKWCFWIHDEQLSEAIKIPIIRERIDKVKQFREKGGGVARGIANRPHQFRYTHEASTSQVVIPIVSSENRYYIPIGYLDNKAIILSSAAAIYDPEPYVFGVISSRMHMCWVKITAGRLDNRIRYLSAICYNTFPIPALTSTQKKEITAKVYLVLEEREKYSDRTIAQMYDPNKMPDSLREAHQSLDLAVERCYRSKPFTSDEERLEYLFRLYEQMIAEEKQNKK